MKKILIFTLVVLLLSSCFKDKGDVITPNPEKNGEASNIEMIGGEGKDISKDKTQEELTEIINKEREVLNTPTTKLPFYELDQGGGDIEEIQKAGGMEVTREGVYLVGFHDDYKFLDKLLTEEEKTYSFHGKNVDENFFYLNGEIKDFISKLKNSFSDAEVVLDEVSFMEIGFTYEEKRYIVFINKPTDEPRGQIDDVLGTISNAKVTIFTNNISE